VNNVLKEQFSFYDDSLKEQRIDSFKETIFVRKEQHTRPIHLVSEQRIHSFLKDNFLKKNKARPMRI
jgi:hypothetical protein